MSEILEQMSGNLPQLVALGTLGAVSAYTLGLAGVSMLGNVFSEKITSQEHLDRLVREESKSLGMEVPEAVFCEDESKASCQKSEDNRCRVNIGGAFATRSTVRHEVYHVHKDHPKKPTEERVTDILKYLFVQEPQAIAYSVLGIKL